MIANTIPIPKKAPKIPRMMPINPTTIASKITVCLICFLVAPIDENNPMEEVEVQEVETNE